MVVDISRLHREGEGLMSDERIVADHAQGVVHDPMRTPGLDALWFDAAFWRGRGVLVGMAGGRGGVFVVATPVGPAVLRHYRRGGSVARLLGDRYLWTRQASVRSVVEYRLLKQLFKAGLPVPEPLGGRWQRDGLYYRADLLTRQVPGGRPLSADLEASLSDMDLAGRIGECIGRFHALGVFHADLNAHNILLDETGSIALIDLDRGAILPPRTAWQQANLRRLHRSLAKLDPGDGRMPAWQRDWWGHLLAAHARVLAAS